MKLKGKVLKVSLVLVVLIVGVVVASVVWHGKTFNKNWSSNLGFSLTSPAFAQTGELPKFPADEAGISAYVNVGQNIDLKKAKTAFTGLIDEGNDYVIGTFNIAGLPEEAYPHVYINQSGWILAYYTKISPSSLIMQWSGYEGGPIVATTFMEAISRICIAIKINFSTVENNVGYYHFQYPEATKMLLVTDYGNGDFFTYMIPMNVTVYEASWSRYGGGDDKIDDKGTFAGDFNFGNLEDTYMTQDKVHTATMSSHWSGAHGFAVTFIYK